MQQLRLISHAISSPASSEILASSASWRRQIWSIQYFNIKIIRSWAEKRYLHPLKKVLFSGNRKKNKHVARYRRKDRKWLPTEVLNLLHTSPLSTLCQVTVPHIACKIQGSEVAGEDYYRLRSGREDSSFNYEFCAILPPPLKFKALHFIFT